MLILEDRRFVYQPFESEAELEQVVIENAEYLFGPASIYIPKTLIETRDGDGTIPDGYVVDLSSRVWYIVEAEISRHSVWGHIAPQVAKQLIAASNPSSKQKLIEKIVQRVRDDGDLMERFEDESIHPLDVHRTLAEIIDQAPIVAMPIDAVKDDLREWAATLRVQVKLWIVRKYVEFGRPENVVFEIPEEFSPVAILGQSAEETNSEYARYDVTIADLLEAKLLEVGQTLTMPYKRRSGEPRRYEATIAQDGAIELLGNRFPSPSYAALFAIQDAGSSRKTVNGWISWRTPAGELLSSVRDRYLAMKQA